MHERVEVLFYKGSIDKIITEREVPSFSEPLVQTEERKLPITEERPVYLVGSRCLWGCFEHLMSRNTEMLHNVSGVKHDGIYTLERLEPLELDESSPVYARSNLLSTKDTLMGMHQYGYLLTGVFHSHPGLGREAVHPSQIDIKNQKKLEDAGYRCISGIFSKDGWVRFFTVNHPFKVVVEGKGVERVEENLFKLHKTQGL